MCYKAAVLFYEAATSIICIFFRLFLTVSSIWQALFVERTVHVRMLPGLTCEAAAHVGGKVHRGFWWSSDEAWQVTMQMKTVHMRARTSAVNNDSPQGQE